MTKSVITLNSIVIQIHDLERTSSFTEEMQDETCWLKETKVPIMQLLPNSVKVHL